VTFKEGFYFWSSAEAYLVFSGRTETECKIPSQFVALTDEQREII